MLNFINHSDISRGVRIWLIIGLVMIFFQVILGGITRLTGSGLSITKWELVTGTIPPLNNAEWTGEFELYKETPQYQKINSGMSLKEFKVIYFWEYFHRLWARTMGFVFLFPFLYFWISGKFSSKLFRQLLILFVLAVLVASFGWIMVASGLTNRPWVNAYKLSFHLSLAFILFGYLFWIIKSVFNTDKRFINIRLLKTYGISLTIVLSLQIILGGIMSGMKAGLWYPTFPLMNGEIIPTVVYTLTEWNVDNFVNYDANAFMPALIQVLHRITAILLAIITIAYIFYSKKNNLPQNISRANTMWIIMLVIQFGLGILTVINCTGSIPLTYGVLHQAGGLILLMAALNINYIYSTSKK